jgi:hypothetical protein
MFELHFRKRGSMSDVEFDGIGGGVKGCHLVPLVTEIDESQQRTAQGYNVARSFPSDLSCGRVAHRGSD